jgi:hypothetical protein
MFVYRKGRQGGNTNDKGDPDRMSFNYNPYEHIEVLHKRNGNFKLYCHSCGAIWGDFTGGAPAWRLFQDMAQHIKESHNRSRESFAGWSQT